MQPPSASPVVFHPRQVSSSSQTSSPSIVQPPAISQVSTASPTVMPSASTVQHSVAQSTPLPQPVVPQATQRHGESNPSCLTAVGVAGTVASLTAGTIACCVSPVVGLQICGYGFTAAGSLVTTGGLHDAARRAAPGCASMEDGPAQHPAVPTGGGIAIASMGLTSLGVLGVLPVLPFSVTGALGGGCLAVYGACKD